MEVLPMRAVFFISTICLTTSAATLAAQKPAAHHPAAKPAAPAAAAGLKPSDVAGTWTVESAVKTASGQDTVVTSELTVSADAKTWVTHLKGRDPVATRVVAMAGDSVVTESGPFQSVARPGQKVRTVEVFHFKGNEAWGTIEAHYSNKDVVRGTIKGKRKK
jgi:hypothetical protein